MLSDTRCNFNEPISQHPSTHRDLLTEMVLTLVCQNPFVHIKFLVKDRVFVLSALKKTHWRRPDHLNHVVVLALWIYELLKNSILSNLSVVKEVNKFFSVQEFEDCVVLRLWIFIFNITFNSLHLVNHKLMKIKLFIFIWLSNFFNKLKITLSIVCPCLNFRLPINVVCNYPCVARMF